MIALITGASSGIGAACARAFAEEGWELVLAARRSERLAELAEELPTPVRTVVLDVRDRAAVETALDGVEVDVLVNNAGLAAGFGPLLDNDPDDWDRMLDTNVRGLLDVTRVVVAGMVARGRGHVVNIGSIAGHEPYPSGAVYCASKHAVDAITKALRMDLLGTGVKVSTVDPGLVETEFSVVRFHGDQDAADRVYKGMTPLTGADIAAVVLWVATRPAHVQIAEVVVFPADQASATRVHRRV